MSAEEKKREPEKKIDAGWKEEVRREKENLRAKEEKQPPRGAERQGGTPGKPDFQNFITSLASEALIMLGAAPNPMTGQRTVDLRAAKVTIDTIQMLQEKTQGNLSPQEEQIVESILHQVRMHYVQTANRIAQQSAGGDEQQEGSQQ